MSEIINHDNILDLSHAEVDTTQQNSLMSIMKLIGIKNKRITSTEKTLKLDDKVAMALLNVVPNDSYLRADSCGCIFMTVLLFPLLSLFGGTDDIPSFKTLLYACMYLNKCYTDYCRCVSIM